MWSLDIRQFEAVVASAEAATATGDLDAATDEYERALRLWRGDYLEEFRDSEWAGVASDHAARRRGRRVRARPATSRSPPGAPTRRSRPRNGRSRSNRGPRTRTAC